MRSDRTKRKSELRGALTLAALLVIGCGGGGGGGIFGDSVMMSDRTPMVRAASGTEWKQNGMTVISANLIHAADSTAASFSQATDQCLIYQGVTSWASNKGLDPITISSSNQTITGNHDGTRYVLTGLQQIPAFAASDTMTVTATDSGGGSVSQTVTAPPEPADVLQVLGEPNRLSTPFRAPDGGFDVFYVAFIAKPSGAGDSGGMCTVPAAQMQLDGSVRTAPLLSDEVQQVLKDRGMEVQTIYAAYYKTGEASSFFPDHDRSVPIEAGRMFEVAASELF